MTRTIKVEIPLIVGSNSKWCASGNTSTAKDGADWGFMADSLQNADDSFPGAERRYVVTATVIVPDETPEPVIGTIEAV